MYSIHVYMYVITQFITVYWFEVSCYEGVDSFLVVIIMLD